MGAPGKMQPIEVLVVDDSALVRQAMTMLLSRSRQFNVRVANDPMIGERKILELAPDVILLDLEMPGMDGLTFLRRLNATNPIPVVVCSSLATAGSDTAMRALEEGALDVIEKPKLGVKEFLEESIVQISDSLVAAAGARVPRPRRPALPELPDVAPRNTADHILPARAPRLGVTTDKVVAIGASTGGTEALRALLRQMPPDCPGIVVVQHMPEVFTAAFAKRLNEVCAIEVKEAQNGDRVSAGRALIAPGNHHMLLRRSGAQYLIDIVSGPLVSRHRPSVDVLFRSAAQAAATNAIGVIMTGMGDDGAAGMAEMKAAGSYNIAQDEESCVVFGMPKEAIEAGAVHEIVPLPRLAHSILRQASGTGVVARQVSR